MYMEITRYIWEKKNAKIFHFELLMKVLYLILYVKIAFLPYFTLWMKSHIEIVL